MPSTVRARWKYGADSLDLTIPASICSKLDICVGDVFEVTPEVSEGKIKLEYSKMYKYREQ